MPQTVRAEQGDSIDSIAARHGHAPATLWDAPENAALRELRGNPNVLLPGDSVFVPDRRVKEVSAATDRSHVFRRRGVPSRFQLQLLREGEPRAGVEYTLEVAGQVLRGATDAEGRLEHWVPPHARSARLVLADGESYALRLGHLDPVTEDSGLDARLASLGYLDAGAEATPELRARALRRFQADAGLETTGEADERTRAALVERHGC